MLEVVREAQVAKLFLDLRVFESEEENEEDQVAYEMSSRADRKEVPAHQLCSCYLNLRGRHSRYA